MNTNLSISELQQAIINQYQRGFPICSQPYQVIAEQLNSNEKEVLIAIEQLDQQGMLSRIGPVFDHKKAGASTLAALAVPARKLDKVAAQVNQFNQVNHNYAREHHYNLWFVVTESDQSSLLTTIENIKTVTGLPVLMLPMEAAYHIDLSFKINFNDHNEVSHNA